MLDDDTPAHDKLLRLSLLLNDELLLRLRRFMPHRGTAAFGHYYAYIKDFKTGQWLNFNDGTVTAASVSDVESAFGGKQTKATTTSNPATVRTRSMTVPRESSGRADF